MPTMQPSSASRRAIAAPMPLAPPVSKTVRSFSPRMWTLRSTCLRHALIAAACQHAGGFAGDHDIAVLILHVDPGHDDTAIALRCGTHRRDLDLAMHRVADADRRQDL